MNSVMISVVVTGIFFLVQAATGIGLGRAGKPYNVMALSIHKILFLFVAAGLIASIYKLQAVIDNKLFSTIFLYAALAALLADVISGIIITPIKDVNPALVLTHKLAALLMLLLIIAAIISLAVKI